MTDPGAHALRGAGSLYARLLGSLVLVGVFAWFLHAGALPLVPPASSFARVRWWTVGGHALLYLLALYLRAVRWSWLLGAIQPVPRRKVVAVSYVGYAALVTLPFRAGEMVRPILIAGRTGVSFLAASGTVAAERIVEGLLLCVVLLVGLQLAAPPPEPSQSLGELALTSATLHQVAWLATGVFLLALLLLVLFYSQRARARRLVEASLGLLGSRVGVRVADGIDHLAMGLASLPRPRETLLVCGATVAYYLLNALALQLLVWGVGIEGITLAQATVVVGILHLGVLVPNAPGYFGSYQIALYAGLALYVTPDAVVGAGAAAVFLMYVVQIGSTILLGGAGWMWLRRDDVRERAVASL